MRQQIYNIGTEAGTKVYLRAISNNITSKEMRSYMSIIPTASWNRNDFYPNGSRQYKNNWIDYEPNPEADTFKDKLEKLLISLRRQKNGLLALSSRAEVYIQADMDFHAGNQLLGGALINLKSVHLMAALNLEINFDLLAWGKPFN